MKQLIYLLGFLLIFTSCTDISDTSVPEIKKWTEEEWAALDVPTFVAALKDGTYKYREISDTGEVMWMNMPDFDKDDIPQLLLYAKDTTHIKEFPVNPISSRFPYHLEDGSLILSECLLWTIDGIRIGKKFPSLDPVLTKKEGGQYRYLNGAELLKVLDAFNSWWKKVQDSDKLIEEVSPLEGTAWQWS